MIHTVKVGDYTVTSVVEYYGPTHKPDTFAGCDRDDLQRNMTWLVPSHYVPHMDKFVIAITLWVVKKGDDVILIDTGYGNRKPRGIAHADMLNTLTLAWLEAAGATQKNVTHVIATHLHSDHVGWNTVMEDGKWVPAFPNATYHFPRLDYAFFESEFRQVPMPRRAAGFGDSVKPIMEAGLGVIYDAGDELPGAFKSEAAYGHTPGMVSLWFESRGERGVFCADIFHHPIQIASPAWNAPADADGDAARSVRRAFLERIADTGTIFFPCHFAPPGCGRVRRTDGGYAYEPAL